VIRTSFDEQSSPNETRLLCTKREKRKKEFIEKEIPETVLLLADSSFAFDVQHDKRRSLQDWHPGCN
jgi:hypothetical protein